MRRAYNWKSLSFDTKNLVALSMCFLIIFCFSDSSLGTVCLRYLFMNITNCFLSNGGCSYTLIPQKINLKFIPKVAFVFFLAPKVKEDLKEVTELYLKPKSIDDINNLYSLVINSFVFTTFFSWWICSNVEIHRSFHNPLVNKGHNTMYIYIYIYQYISTRLIIAFIGVS